jgi:predicted nucleotidyltransferase
MPVLHEIAREVAVNERTLRRAVERGLIRAQRVSPRRLDLAASERLYVERHWPTLARLLASLRTRHNVRLAVLFGSFARGDAHSGSDMDLLVDLADGSRLSAARLAGRLAEELGRRVQVVLLRDARDAPLLLADVLRDGRVLIDRDGAWPRLKDQEPTIVREATEAEARLSSELEDAAAFIRASA